MMEIAQQGSAANVSKSPSVTVDDEEINEVMLKLFVMILTSRAYQNQAEMMEKAAVLQQEVLRLAH